MLMKIFPKGQVVIPVQIRKKLGLQIGDFLDVEADYSQKKIELKIASISPSSNLAGCFSSYAKNKSFPSRKDIHQALNEGFNHGR